MTLHAKVLTTRYVLTKKGKSNHSLIRVCAYLRILHSLTCKMAVISYVEMTCTINSKSRLPFATIHISPWIPKEMRLRTVSLGIAPGLSSENYGWPSPLIPQWGPKSTLLSFNLRHLSSGAQPYVYHIVRIIQKWT